MTVYIIHKVGVTLPPSIPCILDRCIHSNANILGLYTKRRTTKRLVTFWNNRGKNVMATMDFRRESPLPITIDPQGSFNI